MATQPARPIFFFSGKQNAQPVCSPVVLDIKKTGGSLCQSLGRAVLMCLRPKMAHTAIVTEACPPCLLQRWGLRAGAAETTIPGRVPEKPGNVSGQQKGRDTSIGTRLFFICKFLLLLFGAVDELEPCCCVLWFASLGVRGPGPRAPLPQPRQPQSVDNPAAGRPNAGAHRVHPFPRHSGQPAPCKLLPVRRWSWGGLV